MTTETQTRDALLEAAQNIAARNGIGAVTMERVARACGLTRQSVYLHFGSRSKLLTEMMRKRLLEHPDAREARVLSTQPATVERLELFIQAGLALSVSILELAISEFAAATLDEAVREALAERLSASVKMTERMTIGLKEKGLLRDQWNSRDAATWILHCTGPNQLYMLTRIFGWPMRKAKDSITRSLLEELLVDCR